MQVTKNKFDAWGEFYSMYSALSLEEFKELACNYIKSCSVSSNQKKYRTITQIREKRSKDQILKMVTNFYLAGEGLKVI